MISELNSISGINQRPVIDTSSQQYQDLFEKYRPGIDGVYSSGSGFGPVTQNRTYLKLPSMQDMTALGYYDPNPMTREHKGPMMAEFMNNLYRQPASGDANLGFGSVQNPSAPGVAAGIAGMIPAGPSIMDPGSSGTAQIPIIAATGPGYVNTTSQYSNLDVLNPNYIPGSNPFGDPTETAPPGSPGPDTGFGPSNMQPILTSGVDYDAQANPFEKLYSEDMSGSIDAVADPITNNFMPLTPQQQPGGGMPVGTDTTDSFGIGSNPIMNNPIAPMPNMPTAPNTQPGHSHDDLLSGIGKLFEQYFPQQGSQQINQPSPMFDAAGNSVPDGQTQSNQVFGNMITPNFGGGY